jgi:hypothetical protein
MLLITPHILIMLTWKNIEVVLLTYRIFFVRDHIYSELTIVNIK